MPMTIVTTKTAIAVRKRPRTSLGQSPEAASIDDTLAPGPGGGFSMSPPSTVRRGSYGDRSGVRGAFTTTTAGPRYWRRAHDRPAPRRGMTASKVASMADAIRELVRDGDTVAIEGFTHLISFAAGHEIIRQGRRDLTLARMTPDVIYDQMIAAGVARKLIFSWLGNPGVGGLGAIRRRTEPATSAAGG